jgi:predicted transcriptional regulator
MGGRTLADRIAAALRRTRPEGDGPALAQWSEDVVAVAAGLAEADPGFDYGRFYSEAGGL